MDWKISDEETENVIIGRPLLESIGCNNRRLLEDACDSGDGIIDTGNINQEACMKQPSETIAALLTDAIFHSAGGYENDVLGEDDHHL